MLETHIKILASFYTALLIAAVGSLLVFGGFKFKTPAVKGQVISATMIDISQLNSLNKPKTTNKPPIKKPIEKEIEKPIKPTPKEPVKKPIEQPVEKPVEKPKIDTQAQALERKKTIERQKKLEEIRKKKITAQKKSEQAEQDLKDLANKIKEEDQPVIDNIGSVNGDQAANERNQLMARYQLAVISKVEKQWNKPASANKNLLCHVKVRQIPGGGVMDATIASPCNANAIVRKSIIAAIIKADPLPFKGFEKVFDRTSTFIFQPQD